jgi:formyltetrahydrofolate deformylase
MTSGGAAPAENETNKLSAHNIPILCFILFIYLFTVILSYKTSVFSVQKYFNCLIKSNQSCKSHDFRVRLRDKSRLMTAIILIHCPDQPGIVAKVTEFIHSNRGNIVSLEQHVDRSIGRFFMRLKWDLAQFMIPKEKINDYFQTLIATPYQMKYDLYISEQKPRMAIFVSKMSHCLYDILSRWESGDWQVDIPLIISNHTDMQPIAERFGIAFHYLPVTAENKDEQEARQLALLQQAEIDMIVLARYMQVLTADFLQHYPDKVINIHHSFLPAFAGAKPYHAAYERGVKIVGATSHYVTGELDAGPIIEQDVIRVSHKDSLDTFIRKGKDLEKIVLSRGVFLHIQRKLLVYNNRTIVFG